MQFSNFLSSGLSNFLFSICIQAATLTVCSPYLEARVTSPNFGMTLFPQNGRFVLLYVLNEYLSKHLCKKNVLNDLSSLKFCLNWKQFRDVEIRNMSEFQVCSVKQNIGADENIFLEYFWKAHSASVQYCATRLVWNKSEADPGEHLRFAPAVENISQVWNIKITILIKMVEKLAFLWGNGDDHDVIECRFASSQMRGWKGWGLRRRIKWRSRQNGFPRISNKFYCPFEPIWFAQISWILISFQKVPSGP